MNLSPAQFAALTVYVEAAAKKAAVDMAPNSYDDCHGIQESLALFRARDAAEDALVWCLEE